MADRLWLGPGCCRLNLHDQRTSVHRDWHRASGILRRNAAQRSTRDLASAAAGADDQRQWRAAELAILGVVARDRTRACGSFGGVHGPASYRDAAPMDAE